MQVGLQSAIQLGGEVELSCKVLLPDVCFVEFLLALWLAFDRVFNTSNATHIWALLFDFDLVELVATGSLGLLDLDVFVEAIYRLLLNLERELFIDIVCL